MTVSANDALTLFTGDGSTVEFNYDFPCSDVDDIAVFLDGVETTAFSVNLTTQLVTLDTAPANGVKGAITRNTTITQLVTYSRANNSLNLEGLANQLDAIVKHQQETTREAANASKGDYTNATPRIIGPWTSGEVPVIDANGNLSAEAGVTGAKIGSAEQFATDAETAKTAAEAAQTAAETAKTGAETAETNAAASASAASTSETNAATSETNAAASASAAATSETNADADATAAAASASAASASETNAAASASAAATSETNAGASETNAAASASAASTSETNAATSETNAAASAADAEATLLSAYRNYADTTALSNASVPSGIENIVVAGKPWQVIDADHPRLGPDLITHEDSDWATTGNWTVSSDVASCTPGSGQDVRQGPFDFSNGDVIFFEFDITAVAAGDVFPRLIGGGSDNGTQYSTTGVKTGFLTATSDDRTHISLNDNDGDFDGSIDVSASGTRFHKIPSDAVQSNDGRYWAAVGTSKLRATRERLKVASPRDGEVFVLTEGVPNARGRFGSFAFSADDLSSKLVAAEFAVDSVNGGSNTFTKTAHGLLTGMGVFVDSDTNGLTANTFYWVIRVDANNFKVAATLADALAGTAFDITGGGTPTIHRHADPMEGYYIVPDGKALDGSQGAFVRMLGGERKLYPGHFGAPATDTVAEDAWPAISCGLYVADLLEILFQFDGVYGIGQRIALTPTMKVDADKKAQLQPQTGSGLQDGMILSDGTSATATGRISLPRLVVFPGVAFENHHRLANIYIEAINTCGTGLKYVSDGTVNGGNSKTEFGSISSTPQPIEFNGATGGFMQGNRIFGQFVTGATNLVLFSGDNIPFDGQYVEIGSVDVTEANGVMIENTTGSSISRFVFRSPCWFGGAGFDDATNPTQLVSGEFVNLDCDIVANRAFDQTNLNPGDGFAKASRWQFHRMVAKSSAYELATTLAGFNSGTMLHETEFMVKITLGSDLVDGATLVRYFYHILADHSYYNWEVQRGEGGIGALVDYVQDQNLAEAGRVVIGIRNLSGATISSGAVLYFAVRRK